VTDARETATQAAAAPVPLLDPREGIPPVTASPEALEGVVAAFAAGSGPVAVDAERASGYRYGQRAYLVQLRRAGAGTVLIDTYVGPYTSIGADVDIADGQAAARICALNVLAQLKKVDALKGLEKPLDELWKRSSLVATMAYVVARRLSTKVNPDTAMLAGLLHGVGHLYILTRANKHPRLFANEAMFQSIVSSSCLGYG